MGILCVMGVACVGVLGVGVWVCAWSACFFRGAAHLAGFILVSGEQQTEGSGCYAMVLNVSSGSGKDRHWLTQLHTLAVAL